MILEVKNGDTLSGILRSADISVDETFSAISAMQKIYDPANLKIGQKVKVYLNLKNGTSLESLQISTSKLEKIIVEKSSSGYTARNIISKTTIKNAYAEGEIKRTLYNALIKGGVPDNIRSDFVKNYSYDVDFQRDIRSGNQFKILYERVYNDDNELVGGGRIIYSSLKTRGDPMQIYLFEKSDGQIEYFDENGFSIKKSFLRTPVDGARITSSFGARKHPILGYTKMHKGLDFGASRGTPIYAAGDGVIIEARRKGAYGNYIKIHHNNNYSTAYAHLNGFAKKIRRGTKVKQGDIIGYVGTTGRSTGPHLHYELIKNGVQINPLSVKTTSRYQLKSLDLGIFLQYGKQVHKLAKSLSSANKIANANP